MYNVYAANNLKIFEEKDFSSFAEAWKYAKDFSKKNSARVDVSDNNGIVTASYENGKLTSMARNLKGER